MQIGILSQICNEQDMEIFKTSAIRKNIELQVLNPSSLVIAIRNNKLVLLDHRMQPIKLSGIINWEPYPFFEEVEKACICLGIPFINRMEAVRIARNKMLTSVLLAEYGLPQPDTVYHYNATVNTQVISLLDMPLVSKPKTGTQGRGAYKLSSPTEFSRFAGEKYSKSGFYLQSFIPNDGWDLRVVVVGDQVLGAIKKIAAPGEWRTHVMYGGKAVAFPVDKELEQLSLCTVKALGLSFAGIDVIVDKRDGKLKILEVNAVPGLKIFAKTTGICIASAVLDLMAGCANKECCIL